MSPYSGTTGYRCATHQPKSFFLFLRRPDLEELGEAREVDLLALEDVELGILRALAVHQVQAVRHHAQQAVLLRGRHVPLLLHV
jgi:hypothetical protein